MQKTKNPKPATAEEWEAELERVQAEVRNAIRDNDEEALMRLRARTDILPAQILRAKIDEAEAEEERISGELKEIETEREKLVKAQKEAASVLNKAKLAVQEADEAFSTAVHALNHNRFQRDQIQTKRAEISQQIKTLREKLNAYIGSK